MCVFVMKGVIADLFRSRVLYSPEAVFDRGIICVLSYVIPVL